MFFTRLEEAINSTTNASRASLESRIEKLEQEWVKLRNEDAANEYKIKLCWLFSSYKQCIKLYSNSLVSCDNLKTRNKL